MYCAPPSSRASRLVQRADAREPTACGALLCQCRQLRRTHTSHFPTRLASGANTSDPWRPRAGGKTVASAIGALRRQRWLRGATLPSDSDGTEGNRRRLPATCVARWREWVWHLIFAAAKVSDTLLAPAMRAVVGAAACALPGHRRVGVACDGDWAAATGRQRS